ncbi:type II secretion system protein J [Deinococcus sp. Leaf326]|uniref:PulJ/GspJ family protein n=1 Tax=Deinococcus sp. Leaf326 TaxID=1736338 RepID=UPI0006F81D21|nr:type II secretion system protein [Deinococcus sp. Leaf326]KQR11260.1 hypothetical protein ASF71_20670 [Deinococcus sp. Leaf326]
MRHPPDKTRGFTLIEVLVAIALLAGLFYSVGPLLTRSTQANRQTVLAAGANSSITRLGEQIAQDIRGGETLLASASVNSLDMYKLRQEIVFDLNRGHDRYQGKTLHILNNAFASYVGKDVMIVGSQGEYMPTRVVSSTPDGTGSVVEFSCNMNMPGGITAFTYGQLKLEKTAQGLVRTKTDNGVSAAQVVATNVDKLVFEPTYGAAAGRFTATAKAPAPRLSNQKLDGVNYAITSSDEQPVMAAGYVQLGLPGIYPWPCNANPVAPPNNLGKLGLNVTLNEELVGPATLRPRVYVRGPGLSTTKTTFGAQVYDKIAAGTYIGSADPITVGNIIYDPRVARSPAKIGNGLQETIFVDYTVRKGRVVVQVSGLPTPPPASGLVTFSGPETVQVPAQTGAQEVRLTPGTYGINADPIGAYVPTVSVSTLVVDSTTNTVVTINYAVPKGSINVQVTGLPATYTGGSSIRVSGPESATIPAANGGATLLLVPGQYTVQADDAGTYKPTISTTTLQVDSNKTTTVTINYADSTPPVPGGPPLPGDPVVPVPGGPPIPGGPPAPTDGNFALYFYDPGNTFDLSPLFIWQYRLGSLYRTLTVTSASTVLTLDPKDTYVVQTPSREAQESCEYPIGNPEDMHCFITSTAITSIPDFKRDVQVMNLTTFRGIKNGVVLIGIDKRGGGRGGQGGCAYPNYYDEVTKQCLRPKGF